MKNLWLVSLIAFLAVFTLATGALAAPTGNLGVDLDFVEVKGIMLSEWDEWTEVSAFSGEVVPVRVVFESFVNESDARIKAWIGGEDISATSRRIHLLVGGTYSETLSLKLPTDIDPEEAYTLYVSVETQNEYRQAEFSLKMQRESYNLEILDVDSVKTVNAGSNLAVDVVLRNSGFEELDNVFVVVSIPELDVEKKAYFEDLAPVDECDEDCDKKDTAERRISLRVPGNVEAGVYELRVEAYNSDSSDVRTRSIAVEGTGRESNVVVPVKSKEVAAGEVGTFDLVIVNSGSRVGVYEIVPESVEGVIVDVEEPVVTVAAGSSKVVKVNVKGTEEGTYSFAVSVNSEDELVKKVVMNAVVSEGTFSGNLAVWTLVLAIVFVILLVVLIVLLARKPGRTEEFEESYY